jgi:hypothetical protein
LAAFGEIAEEFAAVHPVRTDRTDVFVAEFRVGPEPGSRWVEFRAPIRGCLHQNGFLAVGGSRLRSLADVTENSRLRLKIPNMLT